MSKFSFLDPRYSDLSAKESIRQVERDNLLYEQTEAIKNINSTKTGNIINPSSTEFNIFFTWFITFVIGGLALVICIIADKDYGLGLGNIPYYIYFGSLIGIIILGIILKIFKSILYLGSKLFINKKDVEKQIRKLQRNWNALKSKIKIEETRLLTLESKLRTSIMYENDIEKEIEKEIIKTRTKIEEYEEEQVKIEEDIEKLENKIY